MPESPLVSVVIIHWNTPGVLKEQLSLLRTTREVEVIVVDNFSSKEVRKQVSLISAVATRTVLNNENLGFAKAGNIGARLARGEWLLFLNPDVLITSESVLAMADAAAAQSFAAVSPKTTDPRYSKPQPSPFSLIVEFSPLHRLLPLSLFKQKTLTGGCLLICRDIFEQIGKWDEQFFLWFEDSDLTKRLIDAGHTIGWIDVDAPHQGGASFTSLNAEDQKNIFFGSMKLYAGKHFSWIGNRVVKLLAKRFSDIYERGI